MSEENSQSAGMQVIQPHALELIERAQIDMQITTAKNYPRDLATVKKKMLSFATLDEETAESCFYTLRRKGGGSDGDEEKKTIQGPSVRLAEIAVACYQNLRAASRVIENDGRFITSQGVCHDLENNTLISVEVLRRITDRRGRTYSDDMQVVTGNAANSIAFRNAVFKVIPGALIKPVYEAAKKVAVGDASTLQVKRDKILARLNSMGAELDRVLAVLGKKGTEFIDLEDLETLIGLGTAIKDGDTTVDEAFPPVKTEMAVSSLKDRVKEAAGHGDKPTDGSGAADNAGQEAGAPQQQQQEQPSGSPASEPPKPDTQETTQQPGPKSAPEYRLVAGELPDPVDVEDDFLWHRDVLVSRIPGNAGWRQVSPQPPVPDYVKAVLAKAASDQKLAPASQQPQQQSQTRGRGRGRGGEAFDFNGGAK